MGDSFPTDVKLPTLKYHIGQEPNSNDGINQCARYEFIERVEEILTPTEFQRIRESFLGPVLKAEARGLNLSGKLIHCFLARSLTTAKKNELWFHFGGQPMKFSIREFHMVTGLKCSPQETAENVQDNRYALANTSQQHTSEELLEILRNTNRNSGDERFLLAMLLLTECIFLNLYKGNKFPAAHLKRAQDVQQFLNYPWGIDAFKVLLSSIKSVLASKLLKSKYTIQGYPLALHLWILESIPVLQSSLSRVSLLEPRTAFICERYTSTTTAQIPQIENLEASDNLNVTCILPAIPNDPEDTVSLEDEDDPELSLLVDLLSKGYKMKAEDWKKGSLDVGDVMEEVAMKSYRFYNKEAVKPSSSGESLMEKLDKLYKLVEDGFKSTNQRLSKMEKKLRILSARKRKDQRERPETPSPRENDFFFNNPPPTTATEQSAEKAPDQTTEQHTVPLTQISQTQTEELTQKISSTNEMNQDETNAENQTQEVTQDINCSGEDNAQHEDPSLQRDGGNGNDRADEQEDNAQHEDPSLQRDTEDGGVNAENRDDSRPTLAQDYTSGIMLMEEVEVFYKNEWRKGEVRAIRPDKLHVLMKDLGQEYMFTFDKIRYSWRWEEQQLLKEKEKGEQSLKEKEKGEQSPKKKEKGGKKLKRIKTPSFDLKIVTPPEEKADEKGNKRQADNTLADNHLKRMKKRKLESRGNDQQILRRSNRVATPSQPLVTPYKAPRNPAAGRHPIFDPLLSPTFDMVEELMAWKESKKTETSIDHQCLQPLTPQWFDELEKPGTYLHATHINAALTMMCMQRDRDPTFFRNRRLPRASFMTIEFMRNLADCHSAFKKDKKGYEFPVELTDVVKGEMPPNKKWGEEIDVVYGVIHSKECNQWIGVEINMLDRRITVLDCQSEKSKNIISTHVTPLTELIPAILNCSTSYQVTIPKKNIIHTKVDANCSLFLLKMIQCHSMKIEDFSKLRDIDSEDIRNKLAVDIFNECVKIS